VRGSLREWKSLIEAVASAGQTPHPALRATFSHKGRRKKSITFITNKNAAD
jgi:hypothetical protein